MCATAAGFTCRLLLFMFSTFTKWFGTSDWSALQAYALDAPDGEHDNEPTPRARMEPLPLSAYPNLCSVRVTYFEQVGWATARLSCRRGAVRCCLFCQQVASLCRTPTHESIPQLGLPQQTVCQRTMRQGQSNMAGSPPCAMRASPHQTLACALVAIHPQSLLLTAAAGVLTLYACPTVYCPLIHLPHLQ